MIQRRAVATALAVGTALLLVGCGFQSPAETSVEHATTTGTSFNIAKVQARNVFIAVPDTSSGATLSGPSAKPYLFAGLINQQASSDNLIGATIDGSGSVTFGGTASGSVPLPPKVLISIASPTLRPDGPTAAVNTTQPLVAGTTVSVQLSFANAGTSRAVQVPVVSAADVSFAPSQFQPVVRATFPAEPGEPANG